MKVMLSVILAVSLVLGSIMLVGPAESGEVGLEPMALMTHLPIHIDSDAGFNATNGVTGGNGTAENPWVIQNISIDGNGAEYCIYVGNTTGHFVIRNCTVYNASTVYRNPPQNASIMCFNVTNGKLVNNTANDSANGIILLNSTCELIQNNVSGNVDCGIQVINAYNCSVINNTFWDNNVGLNVTNSYGYRIFHNNFMNGTWHAFDILGMNYWDSGYPGGGNYWSDYSGADVFNGPDQNWPGADGIGDDWYDIGAVIHDRYPLMSPYAGQAFGEGVEPYAIEWGPIGDSVPIDSGIRIRWNETMNWTSVEAHFSYTDGTDMWTSANGTWLHDAVAFNSTFAPAAELDYGTEYWVIVGCNATDWGGNPLDQNMNGSGGEWPADVLTWNFTTMMPPETVPPYALSFTPNTTAEPADVPIVITWNETMNWTSVEAAFGYTDGTANWTSANGTWAHNSTTNVSTFTPLNPFAYETHYVVTVNSSAADIIGNMLDQNRNGTGGEWPADILTWSFTTDDDAPYVVSTQPADGQIGVDPYKPFKIIFSESMNRTGVELAFSFTNGTGAWNITDGVGYWNALFTEFTFSPNMALETNTTFQANLNGTLAKDLGGKWLKYGDYTWNFMTWQQPPAPKITSTYPPDGALNVNVNTYINIAFDNEMDPASVENAFSYTDGTGVWTAADGMVDWFSENTLFSFQPALPLEFETGYIVRVSTDATSVYGVGLDGNGNGIPEQNDNYTFMFTTTVEPPKVISHYPGLRQMDMPTDLAAIQINFSKVMNLPSVTSAISISPNVPFSTSFYGGGKNLTIVLTGMLLEGTEYRVTVLGTAMDISGIKLDGNGDGWPGDRFSFNFFTKGVLVPTNPTITAIFPLNNATVPVEAFFVAVTFSVPMNRTSVESAFTFKNASATINGTIQWSATNKSFRFTPTEALAYNTTYTVNLAGTAKSMEGLAMGNTSSWQYITEPAEEAPPMMDWVLYGVILMLLALTVILYMANRSLRRDLKRTRVKLKRLKREMGIKDEEKPDEGEKPAAQPEEVSPEEAAPEPDEAKEGLEK